MTTESTKDKSRQQFSRVAEAYVRSKTHSEGEDLRRIVELAEAKPGDLVLDIACGGGHTALALAPHVRAVIATDITPEMLAAAAKHARSKGATNIEFRVADAHALPFGDASFDIATSRIAAHHFARPQDFVAEVRRVLRSGGGFLLEDSVVPPGPAGDFLNRIEDMRDPSHVRSLTIDEWWGLLSTEGFSVKRMETFRKRHELAEWMDRMQAPQEVQRAVKDAFKNAHACVHRAFAVEFVDGEPLAYTDYKAVFLAV